VAFQNSNGTVVVVVANTTSSARSVTVVGSGLPAQFNVFQSTSSSSMMQHIGTVAPGSAQNLPARSITTFTSGTVADIDRKPVEKAQIPTHPVCRPTLNGTGVAVDLQAPALVSFSVFTAQGKLVASTSSRMPQGRSALGWHGGNSNISRADGLYVGRVRIEPEGVGNVTEHTLQFRPR
jgi:hypothetical protein